MVSEQLFPLPAMNLGVLASPLLTLSIFVLKVGAACLLRALQARLVTETLHLWHKEKGTDSMAELTMCCPRRGLSLF